MIQPRAGTEDFRRLREPGKNQILELPDVLQAGGPSPY